MPAQFSYQRRGAVLKMKRRKHGGVRLAILTALAAVLSAFWLLGATPASADLTGDPAVVGMLRGYVSTADGARTANDLPPTAPATRVDLHRQTENGGRGELIRSLTTRTGRYAFAVAPDCYVVVVNAPDGYSFFGEPTQERSQCLGAGGERWVYTHITDAQVLGNISPQSTQYPVKVDIFEARADGSRGRFLNSTTSAGNENLYSFDLRPGCYVLTFIAPDGTSFAGRRWFQPGVCVAAGDLSRVDAELELQDPLNGQAERLDQLALSADAGRRAPLDDNPAFSLVAAEAGGDAAVDAAVNNGQVRGYVRNADGTPNVGARVIVYEQVDHRLRGGFVGSLTTDEFGEFLAPAPLSCYVYVFIAPAGKTFSGSRFDEFPFCNGNGNYVVATLDAESPAIIGGRVSRWSRDEDQVIPEIGIELYSASSRDERGELVDSTVTVRNRYSFGVEPGCYIVDPLLPDGFRIDDDNINHDFFVCVDDGDINLHVSLQITDDPGRGTITGMVSSVDGPEGDLVVELYQQNQAGDREQLVTTGRTNNHDGRYGVVAAPGCYLLVIPAPSGRQFVGGGTEFTFSTCLVHGQYLSGIDAELMQDTMPPGSFGGVVTTVDGEPVENMKITLWSANESGRRGQFVQPGFTDEDGRYWFPGIEGCYWMVYIAPDGESFNGGRFLERKHCVPIDETPFHEIDVSLD